MPSGLPGRMVTSRGHASLPHQLDPGPGANRVEPGLDLARSSRDPSKWASRAASPRAASQDLHECFEFGGRPGERRHERLGPLQLRDIQSLLVESPGPGQVEQAIGPVVGVADAALEAVDLGARLGAARWDSSGHRAAG